MYLSLPDLKARLGISVEDTSMDIELNQLLDASRSWIESNGYDYISKQLEKTAWIYDWYKAVAMDCPNVTAINHIGGTDVDMTVNEDYIIVGTYNHIVKFKSDIIPLADEPMLKITYTAGYETGSIPKILSDAQYYLVCGIKFERDSAKRLFNGQREIKSVDQGPRRVSYTDKGSKSYENQAIEIFNTVFYPIPLP